MMRKRHMVLTVYFLILFIPIYWMANTSLKTDGEILNAFTLYPQEITFDHYEEIFTSEVWRSSFLNSLIYVVMNVLITLMAAIPAAGPVNRRPALYSVIPPSA